MNNKKKLFNGIISLIVAQVIVKVLGLLYKLYLANKQGFGDSGNAIYNSGYQIYALLLTISSIGVPNAVAKLVAEKSYNGTKEDVAQILKSALIVFSIIGIIGSVILAIFAGFISENLLNINEAKYSIIALSPAIFNVCIISVYRGFYNGINKVNIVARSQTIEQITKTILTIVFVEIIYLVTNSNTIVMAAIANFATTIATLCSFLYLYRKNNLNEVKSKIQVKLVKKIIKVSIPISLSAILASLNRNIDSVTVVRFLKRHIGENQAKIQYGILSGKIDAISSLPVSFIIAIATTIVPTISSLSKQRNNRKLNLVGKTYILFAILFAMPCGIGMFAFSDQILNLLFNNTNGSILLKISSIAIIFISLEQIVHSILQGIGKIFIPAISLAVGVIVKLILNIYLINLKQSIIGGVSGACIATLICHIVASNISLAIMKKNLKINLEFSKYVLKPLISSCIMLVCLYSVYFLLKRIIIENIAIILSIVIAMFMYFASVIILKILDKDQLNMIPIISKLINFYEKINFMRNYKEKRRILNKFGE